MEPYGLHTQDTAHWHALVTIAEARVACCLDLEQETYLVELLRRYARNGRVPGFRRRTGPLRVPAAKTAEQLRQLGDQCLIFAGLMPEVARRWGLPVSHFVDAGRKAYRELGETAGGALFARLSEAFVSIMDVLQAMRDLDPEAAKPVDLLEAFDLWSDSGSQRAYHLLTAGVTGALPVRTNGKRLH